MKRRAAIRRHGCQFIQLIHNLIESEAELEELMNFHRAIYTLQEPVNSDQARSCRPPYLNNSDIRLIEEPWNIMICLPPKCGTTNWQR